MAQQAHVGPNIPNEKVKCALEERDLLLTVGRRVSLRRKTRRAHKSGANRTHPLRSTFLRRVLRPKMARRARLVASRTWLCANDIRLRRASAVRGKLLMSTPTSRMACLGKGAARNV